MPFLLRKIRKARWYKHDRVPWLIEGDLQADALDDLRTTGNKLSIYLIDDDDTTLERVASALVTANTEYISDFEYALIGYEVFQELDIKSEDSEGETPDGLVNSWHRDLLELTAVKIVALANAIQTRAERKVFLKRRVTRMVLDALATQQLDRARMKPALLEKLDRITDPGAPSGSSRA
ncbi:MAG: hypothetical protein AABN33_14595 [Acidobacteriota bacterium]